NILIRKNYFFARLYRRGSVGPKKLSAFTISFLFFYIIFFIEHFLFYLTVGIVGDFFFVSIVFVIKCRLIWKAIFIYLGSSQSAILISADRRYEIIVHFNKLSFIRITVFIGQLGNFIS